MSEDLNKNREQVSALADGQLRGLEFAQTVEMIGARSELRSSWHAYHVIGDVLRSSELVQSSDDVGFVARFQSRLAIEIGGSTVKPFVQSGSEMLADVDSVPLNGHQFAQVLERPSVATSANESNFRWKLVAGFASVAAVVAIGWSAVSGLHDQSGRSDGGQLANTSLPALGASSVVASLPAISTQTVNIAGSGPAVMIRDPNLDALLAAHKQFGGTSALQMPTGFLRNATFESTGR